MKYRILNTPFVTPLFRALSSAILRVSGWKIEGGVPPHVTKFVATVAPHTSNWDFVVLIMAAFVLRVDAHWVGKHTLFRYLPFLTYFGGIPVDRSVHHGMVTNMTAMFDSPGKFALAIAPEGTRKATENWHASFWHVAHNAHVPLYPAFICFKTKRAGLTDEFPLTQDMDADMKRLKQFYTQFQGHHPQNFKI